MSLSQNQADLDYLLQRLSEALNAPVRPLNLDHQTSIYLKLNVRKDGVSGIGNAYPVRMVLPGSEGNAVVFGIERFRVKVGDTLIPIAKANNPFCNEFCSPLTELWAVPAEHYQKLYRFLRRGVHDRMKEIPPIMQPQEQERLWNNTLGFLERGEVALERFGVTLKRGVLLTGQPGNGKTMAARWLLSRACRLGFAWRTVRAEEYEMARHHGNAHGMFELDRPGIILFDDLDTALRDREEVGQSPDATTFLSELDGLEVRRGVVYLFTTNAKVKEIDPAFRRPGRIDQIIHFPRPDAILRRRLIEEHWPKEIIENIPVEEVVEKTEGRCFAEVEEIKKLLVMRFLDVRQWDWPWAWESFEHRMEECEPRKPIGFTRLPGKNGHPHPMDDVPF
jgi:hypothetical protein